MSARNQLWLIAFIVGFALGCGIFHFSNSDKKISKDTAETTPPFRTEKLLRKELIESKLIEVTQTSYQLGTTINIKAYADTDSDFKKAFSEAFNRIHEIELLMSTYRPDSPLSRINLSGKARAYDIPAELGMVISESLKFCRLTDGALNIAIPPLLNVYKNASLEKRPPNPEEISVALKKINYTSIGVSEDFKTLQIADDGMLIDLSATAKGYAADEAARVLKEHGINNAFVEAGGDIRFIGTRGDGHPWLTGIQDPLGKNGSYRFVIKANNCAICTSGNYAQGYWLGKERVSHIVNPKTGLPCDKTPSVTVIAPNAFTADSLATALSVLGPKGLEIINDMDGVEALVVTSGENGLQDHMSRGFKQFLKN